MTNASTAVAPQQKCMTLSVVCPQGKRTDHILEDGASLIIGQGGNCGLRLEGDGISPIHCVIQFNEGKVTVQDWCSQTGTTVDGLKITDEVIVDPGVQVGVGGYTLMTQLGVATNATQAAAVIEPSQSADQVEVGRVNESVASPLSLSAVDSEPQVTPAAAATESLVTESTESEPRPASPVARRNTPATPAPVETRRRLTPEQSFNQETIELLQSELELVQSELAERDGQIAELTSLIESGPDDEPVVDHKETEALVARLEDLLEELDRNDHRVRALEELLRAEQETSHAEQEERVQMERWLNDIEQRISEREAESRAEREVLTQRVAELRQQLDESDRQLCEAVTEASPQAAHDGTLQKLRDDNDRLSEELADSHETHRKLEQRIEAMQDKSPEENQQDVIEEALREERMKMAQERATLSRERADLARQIAELQNAAKTQPAAAADEKFNAFRQTLKELHQEEHRDTGFRKPSLGSRISDLWKRLDGPTDTD